MDFSRFFIDRPIFAAVLSIVIFAAGLISIPLLPIGEYPEVVPPSVMVRTVYPGANPKVIAETVASPLEEAITGVEDMMYIKSVAGSDGVLQMTVTFKPGTDPDDATVRVQNRVSQALARLPEDVRRQGVTTQKQSPVFLMVVHLTSPGGKYDTLYLRNYARLHVKDALARLPGIGDAQVFGGGDYAMRAWLDPDRIASRGLTAGDVLRAMREQNVQVSAVIASMDEVAQRFPEGIEYEAVYDTTIFVRDSIKAVVATLLEAVLLVVLVVILFLQTWRASIIPLLGFSINALTMFGLVLAIGIVVDDAIVVVENVERNIGLGLKPVEATKRAMREVTGPIIATALVLCAVFIPTAFISGLTGQFYRQFALTIAISTVISAFNSLTLSPALAAVLLKPHGAPKDAPTRLIDHLFGWLFRPFNRFFGASAQRYQGTVSRALGRRGMVFVVYAVLLVGTGLMFKAVPAGFIPVQDKLYLVAGVKLPEGASISRTDALLRKVSEIAMDTEGVAHTIAFPGLNAVQFTNTPNTGVVFLTLEPFSERKRARWRSTPRSTRRSPACRRVSPSR